MKLYLPALLALWSICGSSALAADTLLVDRAQIDQGQRPAHGLTQADVTKSCGTPAKTLPPRGGQKTQWPTIERWVYPHFTVYFEHGRVIDTVLNQATEDEIGPLSPTR